MTGRSRRNRPKLTSSCVRGGRGCAVGAEDGAPALPVECSGPGRFCGRALYRCGPRCGQQIATDMSPAVLRPTPQVGCTGRRCRGSHPCPRARCQLKNRCSRPSPILRLPRVPGPLAEWHVLDDRPVAANQRVRRNPRSARLLKYGCASGGQAPVNSRSIHGPPNSPGGRLMPCTTMSSGRTPAGPRVEMRRQHLSHTGQQTGRRLDFQWRCMRSRSCHNQRT